MGSPRVSMPGRRVVVEGPHTASISHSTSSSDSNYSGIPVAGINVAITDNDVAGFVVTDPAPMTVDEAVDAFAGERGVTRSLAALRRGEVREVVCVAPLVERLARGLTTRGIAPTFPREANVAFEAFKAGALSSYREGNAAKWLTNYDFPAVTAGDVIKSEIPHGRPSGIEGLVFNTRKPLFADWRVREALILAAVLFSTGVVGVLVRRNPLVMFMCVELMLNAVNVLSLIHI